MAVGGFEVQCEAVTGFHCLSHPPTASHCLLLPAHGLPFPLASKYRLSHIPTASQSRSHQLTASYCPLNQLTASLSLAHPSTDSHCPLKTTHDHLLPPTSPLILLLFLASPTGSHSLSHPTHGCPVGIVVNYQNIIQGAANKKRHRTGMGCIA